MKASDDVEKWLECIKEITLEEATIANIELLLGKGQNYGNQKIWKYYIDFLKSKNSKDLLFVYQRYCRLFISDNQTRKEYWQVIEETEKLGYNVLEHYFTVIEKEAEVGNKNAAHFMLQKAALNNEINVEFSFHSNQSFAQKVKFLKQKIEAKMSNKMILKKERMKTFLRRQRIQKSRLNLYYSDNSKPFPQAMKYLPTMIKLLLQNANAKLLHKLHKSCKYFFNHRPYPVCHRLVISKDAYRCIRFMGQSLILHETDDLHIAQNLYIGESLVDFTLIQQIS